MSFKFSTWSPKTIPNTVTLKYVDPTPTSELIYSYTSALKRAKTETKVLDLMKLSQIIRGCQASLTIIQAEKQIATATNESVKSYASDVIINSTLNLQALEMEKNLYRMTLNRPGNIIYFIIFILTFLFAAIISLKSRYHWYNAAFFCGTGLECLGFLGRILSFRDTSNLNYYLLQYVTLAISPACLMGGIYYLLAQLIIIHGIQFSILKPMWYAYTFIACDFLSLFIQSVGGIFASITLRNGKNTKPGTHIMVSGIAFQVCSMSIFLYLWFDFLNKIYFKHPEPIPIDPPLVTRSFKNFFKLLFNYKSVRDYKHNYLDKFYNQQFVYIRKLPLFDWYPLVITITTLAIYTRCIYRLFELVEGFEGMLISHEVFLMVLDALMVAIMSILFVPFHPYFVLGEHNVIKAKIIKVNLDRKEANDINSMKRT